MQIERCNKLARDSPGQPIITQQTATFCQILKEAHPGQNNGACTSSGLISPPGDQNALIAIGSCSGERFICLVLPKWHCWHCVSLSNTVIVGNREWGPNPVPGSAWQVGPCLNKYIFRDLSCSLLEIRDLSAWRPRNLSEIAVTTVTTTTTAWQKCSAAAFKRVHLGMGVRVWCLLFSMWLYADDLQTVSRFHNEGTEESDLEVIALLFSDFLIDDSPEYLYQRKPNQSFSNN